MNYDDLSRAALVKLLAAHDASLEAAGKDGIVMSYTGRTAPWQIIRQVKPKRACIVKKHSVGPEDLQARNQLWDGENLSAMVTLYKYRGQVDLIVADPPYNTGKDFRYNDKWDVDPNDPDLGDLVSEDDGSRHSKWLRFMTPRLWMMREMLKPNGVIAVCIDHRELYRLGMLMDEIFNEENRLGIINWQKSAASRPDNKHVSTSTEYVLVYAKSIERAKTQSLERTKADNRRYSNPDDDLEGDWREGNLTARSHSVKDDYAIQSPFTGQLHYPAGEGAWRHPKPNILNWLAKWGLEYEERDIGDGREPALMVKGAKPGTVSKKIAATAQKRLAEPNWPFVWFGLDGTGRPRVKTYLKHIKKGKVPTTYWADDPDVTTELDVGATSWGFETSGRTADGLSELSAIVGPGHGFTTVKPMKLIKKIIQLWCRPDGIVMDPFAGSGTTAHAVLALNQEAEANRSFILIEQGNSDKGDRYARSLTAERLKRVISGKWHTGNKTPLPGGFRFIELKREKIDAEAVNALKREEMIDLLLTSYWDHSEKARSYLQRLPVGEHQYLFAVNPKNEGFFLVWTSPEDESDLDKEAFRAIVKEAQEAKLAQRFHVYATSASYTGGGIEFYKIPDKVLEHIGFNTRADAYNNEEALDGV